MGQIGLYQREVFGKPERLYNQLRLSTQKHGKDQQKGSPFFSEYQNIQLGAILINFRNSSFTGVFVHYLENIRHEHVYLYFFRSWVRVGKLNT